MSNIKFYFGQEEKVNNKAIEDGSIYITTDTKKMYADLQGKRVNLTSSVEVKILSDEEFLHYITEGA